MRQIRSIELGPWASLKCLLAWCSCCGFVAAENASQQMHDGESGPSTKMTFVLVRAGSFAMGSPPTDLKRGDNELPQHSVNITRPFYLGVYEVTQGEFSKVMGFNPSEIPGSDRMPVTKVNWYGAISFCNELSKLDGLDAAYEISEIVKEGDHIASAKVSYDLSSTGYRLPTEAEWEFACRAGTSTPFVFGDNIHSDDANFDGAVPYSGAQKSLSRNVPLPVDSFRANPFGLYQMTGNVFEWVWDYYGEHPDSEQTDPIGPDSNSKNERVRKGGAYTSPAHHMRCALRHNVPANFTLFHMGFRVARNAPQPNASTN